MRSAGVDTWDDVRHGLVSSAGPRTATFAIGVFLAISVTYGRQRRRGVARKLSSLGRTYLL